MSATDKNIKDLNMTIYQLKQLIDSVNTALKKLDSDSKPTTVFKFVPILKNSGNKNKSFNYLNTPFRIQILAKLVQKSYSLKYVKTKPTSTIIIITNFTPPTEEFYREQDIFNACCDVYKAETLEYIASLEYAESVGNIGGLVHRDDAFFP